MVKVAEQLCDCAYGHGYLFFLPVAGGGAGFTGDVLLTEVAAELLDGAGVGS